jgi:hypothetical protein
MDAHRLLDMIFGALEERGPDPVEHLSQSEGVITVIVDGDEFRVRVERVTNHSPASSPSP